MLYDPNWQPGPIIRRTDLTKAEIDSLLRVREALVTGKISARRFRMDTVIGTVPHCGTVGCIAGWMGIFAMSDDNMSAKQIGKVTNPHSPVWKKKYFMHLDENKFGALFYGNISKKIKPKDAIKAIDNFFAGKRWPWIGYGDWGVKDAV